MGIDVIIISVHDLPAIFRCKFLSFLYAFAVFLLNKPDLIIQVSDTALRYALLNIALTAWHTPVVQIVHHFDHVTHQCDLQQQINFLLIKFNLRKAAWIIVNSRNTKEQVLQQLISNYKTKIEIVYPGIDRSRKLSTERNYKQKKKWNFICVGSIIERKGYHILIEALAQLKDISFTCHIVGIIENKTYYQNLIKTINKRNLNESIMFTGFIPEGDLHALYRTSDIFILPSLHEGYGIVLGDALCQGLPIIATDVGGVSEIIVDNHTGLIITPGKADELADALRKIVGNSRLAEALSRNALDQCECVYTWDTMKDRVKRLFRELIVA